MRAVIRAHPGQQYGCKVIGLGDASLRLNASISSATNSKNRDEDWRSIIAGGRVISSPSAANIALLFTNERDGAVSRMMTS